MSGGGDTLALDMWLVTGDHYCMTMVRTGPAQPTTTAGMWCVVWGADLLHKGDSDSDMNMTAPIGHKVNVVSCPEIDRVPGNRGDVPPQQQVAGVAGVTSSAGGH